MSRYHPFLHEFLKLLEEHPPEKAKALIDRRLVAYLEQAEKRGYRWGLTSALEHIARLSLQLNETIHYYRTKAEEVVLEGPDDQ